MEPGAVMGPLAATALPAKTAKMPRKNENFILGV